MSTRKDELNDLFVRVHAINLGTTVREKLNECHQRTLEVVTKLEKENRILEKDVETWLQSWGKESRENYELRQEKQVLYSAIRALTK